MGNEYGWRKERLRAEVLRRFWRTSIFITCSTCGSKCGVKSGRTAMLSSCDSLTISWLDSRARSEEHTSELQSRLHLVCRLLLEKKNTMSRVFADDGLRMGLTIGATDGRPTYPTGRASGPPAMAAASDQVVGIDYRPSCVEPGAL